MKCTGVDPKQTLRLHRGNVIGLTAWYAPSPDDIDSLSPEQVRAGNQMALGPLLAYDNVFYQYESGFISDQSWAATRAESKLTMNILFVRQRFEILFVRMRPSFRAVVVEIIKELDTEQRD